MQIKDLALLTLFSLSLTGCTKLGTKGAESRTERYIVVFKKADIRASGLSAKSFVTQKAQSLADKENLVVRQIYSAALQGGVYDMNEAQAQAVARNPGVAYVEKDQVIKINAQQTNATWGLDRLDQMALPLDQKYEYPDGSSAVNAYVIDTGILTSHVEFEGRAQSGGDFVDNDQDATDCNGHGTHVAGTIGSKTYGVAKSARLFAVRVLDCSGSGSISGVIAGIDWVTENHVKPAVANMSLGGNISQALDDALAESVQVGVSYVVAAGNENANACQSSPARVPAAITVGSTTKADRRSDFSNFGSCVDIFAPGSDIKSTWYSSSSAVNTISGTSMAAPHVAGVVALYLSQHPTHTPAQVASAVIAGAVLDKVTDVGTASPNRLANTRFILQDEGEEETPSSELKNGVLVAGLSGDRNNEKIFTVLLPAGSSNLSIELSGGSGDADLYVKAGSAPTSSSYDCRPYLSGNNEKCSFSGSRSGLVYVLVKGYSAYSGASLKASFLEPSAVVSPCSSCARQSATLNGDGDFDYQPDGTYYYSEAGTHEAWLQVPANADFDLYLYRWNGQTWQEVSSAKTITSQESLKYVGSAGYYLLKVLSYRGAGQYELWQKKP